MQLLTLSKHDLQEFSMMSFQTGLRKFCMDKRTANQPSHLSNVSFIGTRSSEKYVHFSLKCPYLTFSSQVWPGPEIYRLSVARVANILTFDLECPPSQEMGLQIHSCPLHKCVHEEGMGWRINRATHLLSHKTLLRFPTLSNLPLTS